MSTYLILDCSYLCHRAAHVFGDLSYENVKTGVVFGFLRDLLYLQEVHGTNKVLFCFDSDESKRRKIYPAYKRKEPITNKDEVKARSELKRQILLLQEEYLPALGYQNIFSAKGYEADDCIASVCQGWVFKLCKGIVVSSDHDLYQILNTNIRIWLPARKEFYTDKDLARDFHGIRPCDWPYVKALAGCKTDNVVGIIGIGEKTAAKYRAGLLRETTEAWGKIEHRKDKMYRVNLPLVKLPFPGTPEDFHILPDQTSPRKWNKLCESLGISSLRGQEMGGLFRKVETSD